MHCVQEGPYDGPLTGMDQYFAVWGLSQSDNITELYKANPYTETWTLKEDGTGLTIAPISPGEEGADILEYQWGKVRAKQIVDIKIQLKLRRVTLRAHSGHF